MMKIALIDDDRVNLQTIKIALLTAGFEVDSFTTYRKAVRSINEKQYDVIITDYDLGRLSGKDLLFEIKDNCPVCYTIMISGYNIESLIDSSKEEMGLKSFYNKPVDLEKLIAELNEVQNNLKN